MSSQCRCPRPCGPEWRSLRQPPSTTLPRPPAVTAAAAPASDTPATAAAANPAVAASAEPKAILGDKHCEMGYKPQIVEGARLWQCVSRALRQRGAQTR
jgi:hypothetical protein